MALLFCLGGALAATAAPKGNSYAKKVTKTYVDLHGEKLVIANQYGNVDIHAWNKKEVQITITISAQAATYSNAKQLAYRVNIVDTRNDSEISCKTTINGTDTMPRASGLGLEKCSVAYTVYLPAGTDLKLTNQFGNILMGDFTGRLAIDEKYGDFTAGHIKTIDTLSMQLGNIFIKNLNFGNLLANGFGAIKIDTVSGDVRCNLNAGKSSDIGLTNGHYNLTLSSKNVEALNFTCVKNLLANIDIDAMFTRLDNKSSLNIIDDSSNVKGKHPAKPVTLTVQGMRIDTSITRPMTDSLKLQLKKKMMTIWLTTKHAHYSTPPAFGNGNPNIKIDAAFGLLTFKEGM